MAARQSGMVQYVGQASIRLGLTMGAGIRDKDMSRPLQLALLYYQRVLTILPEST